ncbi:hypothetical protein CGRA01v4_11444 [Colletotrichum graminicola]|nr:hypothetical protein CGRA01v4_11444 [Colletotrichum graminicola]
MRIDDNTLFGRTEILMLSLCHAVRHVHSQQKGRRQRQSWKTSRVAVPRTTQPARMNDGLWVRLAGVRWAAREPQSWARSPLSSVPPPPCPSTFLHPLFFFFLHPPGIHLGNLLFSRLLSPLPS